MSQSLTILAPSAYLNFTVDALRYIIIQKNFMKMMGKRKTSKKIVQLPLPQPQNAEAGDQAQKIEISGGNRKIAAMDRAMYYTSLGMCWTEVRDRVGAEFGYNEGSSYIDKIVTEARRKIKAIQDEYAVGVATRNIGRIEKIIQEALDEGNKNLALRAMDLLNKTTNIYSNKLEIKNDDNKSFEIKIENNKQ